MRLCVSVRVRACVCGRDRVKLEGLWGARVGKGQTQESESYSDRNFELELQKERRKERDAFIMRSNLHTYISGHERNSSLLIQSKAETFDSHVSLIGHVRRPSLDADR